MNTRAPALILALALAAAAAAPAWSGQASPSQALRREYVRLNHVSPAVVEPVIRMHLDFARGEMIVPVSTPERKVLTITAAPEKMDRLLQIIRDLDVKPADLLITVQLILGSEAEGRSDPELQSDPIVRELRKLLRYKTYTLLDSSLVRAVEGSRSEVILGPKAEFSFAVLPAVVAEPEADLIRLDVRLREESAADVATPAGSTIRSRVSKDLIQSSLNIRSGDKTVVGVSKLEGGENGLILIISGRVLD